MLTAEDAKPLSITAASALAAGAALGLWLSLPPEVSNPPRPAQPQPIDAIDPNLAKYQQVAAAEGASPPPYLIASSYPSSPPQVQLANPDETLTSDDATADEQPELQPADRSWQTADVQFRLPTAESPPHVLVEAAAYPQQLAPPPIVGYGASEAEAAPYPNSSLEVR